MQIKRLLVIVTFIILNGCNAGNNSIPSSNITKVNKLESSNLDDFTNSQLDKALHSILSNPKSNNFLNLAWSPLIEHAKDYHFVIEDYGNYKKIYEHDFTCKDSNNCVVEIPNPAEYFYILIFNNKDFVGAASVSYHHGKFTEVDIDPSTTATYLNSKLQNSSGLNPYEFSIKYEHAFKTAFEKLSTQYKNSVTIHNIIYFYLDYLIINKKISYDEALGLALDNIINNSIDQSFIFNPNFSIKNYYDFLERKHKLEADAALAKSTAEFKEKFDPMVEIIAKGIGGILTLAEKFYPAAAGISEHTGKIKPAYDVGMNIWNYIISGSVTAFGVLDKLEKEINTYSMPDLTIKDSIQHIQRELDEGKIYDRYIDLTIQAEKINFLGNIFKSHIQNIGIDDYLKNMITAKHYTNKDPQLSWIVKNGPNDDGLFDTKNIKELTEATSFITNRTILIAYIHALKNKLQTATDSAHDVNLVENRRVYNELVTDMMLNITARLADSYLLYKNAIYLAQASKYSDDFKGLVTPPIALGVDYEASLTELNKIFKKKFEEVNIVFSEAIITEYDSVPNYAELGKTCNIIFSDGYEKLIGYCKYETANGTKENKTELIYNPNTTSCLDPRAKQGGAIANSGGELSCFLKNIVWAAPGQFIGTIYINNGYNYPTRLITPDIYNQKAQNKMLGKLEGDYKNISERDARPINILNYTDAYNNTSLYFALSSVRTCSVPLAEGRVKPVCETAPLLGCILSNCSVDNDGHSLNFGLIPLRLTTSWLHNPYKPDINGNELYINEENELLRLHLYTDVASRTNELQHYFRIKNGHPQFTITQDDFDKSTQSIFSALITRTLTIRSELNQNTMSFYFEKTPTALGIPLTVYFHDEKGNSQSCFAKVYKTYGEKDFIRRSYITARRHDRGAIKCGTKYKLIPDGSNYDTLQLDYWN